MSYICTVVFDVDVSVLEKVETEHPEVIGGIMEAAQQHMIGHDRYVLEGRTMDIDVYESEESYREFIGKVGHHIARYGELAGAAPQDTLWKKYEQH